MTLPVQPAVVTCPGNGAATVFSFSPMTIFEATDLAVVLVDNLGNQTVLAQGSGATNYSVQVSAYPGTGSITYPATAGTTLPSGWELLIQRLAPLAQPLSLTNAGPYLPAALMQQLDYLTALTQQLSLEISRCITVQITDPVPTIPLPQASKRALQYLTFDSAGNPTTGLPVGTATVSTNMQPVVAGATTQVGLSLLGGAPSLATAAALGSVTSGTLPGTLCMLLGYYTAADGGEGLFSVGTTTTANGGTIINDASGRSWYRLTEGRPYNAKWFGAKGNGSTDDTSALVAGATAAMAANRGFYIPGTLSFYLTSSAIQLTAGILIAGDYGTTTISTNSPGNDVFYINAANVQIRDLTINSTVTKTSGSYINVVGGSAIKLFRLILENHLTGITIASTFPSIIDISEIYFFNTLTTGNGMVIAGGDEIRLRHIIMNSGANPQPNAGIFVVNSGDIVMEDVNVIQHGRDLLLSPGAGQAITSVYATDCFFDTSSQYGLLVQPTSTGSVERCRFIGCWFSSHTISGVLVTGSTGTVKGLEFIDCHAFLNGNNGFEFGYGSGFTLIGCQAAQNVNCGVEIDAGISGITILGCTLGPCGGFGANNYGLFIASGGSDHYIVANNQLQGNTTGQFSNGGSGSNTIVSPNLVA